ncbi:MAG: LCP family protein, partial [bacterium]|nr:LCP family protein [bacterium]
AINILGGIDLEITDKEFKYINSFITETVKETGVGSHQLKSAGMQHLDGVQAVAYSRLRLMDTDFQRTERQRKVLQLCMDKAKTADFTVLNNVLVTVLGQTVSSFEVNDLARAAKNILNYNIVETSGFPFELKDTYIGKQDCVVPTTLASNVSQLHSFLFGIEDYTPSTSVQNISDAIIQKAGSGGGSKVTATTASSQKSTTAATSEAARTTEEEREEESEEELEVSSEDLEEEESTSLEENEASTEENEEEESRLSESESESRRPFESESSRPRETATAAGSSAAVNEPERPRETTSNIFTEKPSYEVQEEQPEGPGKIGGNAGVSAPGETLPLS